MTERTTTMETPSQPPEPGPPEPWTAAHLLPRLRELAACLDPPHAAMYAAMPVARWRDGADLAAQLLLEHRIHRMHLESGHWLTHRMIHTRAVSDLIGAATHVDLVAGLSMLVVAGETLKDDPPASNGDPS